MTTPTAEPTENQAAAYEHEHAVAARQQPVLTVERRPSSGDRGWIVALLPAFPLLLVVLRVWYLSRQDLQTMLLLLQYTNPVGLIGSLLISLVWFVPAAVLVLRALFLLLVVSGAGDSRSRLARAGARTPGWVTVPAVMLAALSWQLRFLPTLVMLAVVIAALQIRSRRDAGPLVIAIAAVAVPIGVGLLTLGWVASAAVQASRAGEPVTMALLVLPPLAAPLLTGPIPSAAARRLLPGLAALLALSAPLMLGSRYLAAPVLPRVAIEVGEDGKAGRVLIGDLVAVDDRFTTVLDRRGEVHFIPGGQVHSQVLCSQGPQPPTSKVSVHGWQVDRSMLSWAAPQPRTPAQDPRCRGQLRAQGPTGGTPAIATGADRGRSRDDDPAKMR